ncbi:MAG: endolytic transglycosylase MltG [Gammaproteobacteria bacterium]
MLNSSRFLGWMVLFFSFVFGWLWMDYQSAVTISAVDSAVTIEIEKGDSFNRITQRLMERGVRLKPLWFKVYAYSHRLAGRLKAGDYEIKQGATAPEILELFISGKTRQYAITFPEGWSFNQVIEAIRNNPYLQHTNIDSETIMNQLGAEYQHPEGFFFPDTYFFEKNSTDATLLKRAYERMQFILNEEWQQKQDGLPLKSPYQALILASIIEKETGLPSERPLIAGVFIRRLEKGMLLQTDPTVIYGMGGDYQGNIRSQDLKAATPYNTYVNKGLPPTPIAMPGRDAIHAALHPAPGESLYFVAKGDGSHVFSNTLKEHNKAVAVYQLKHQNHE